MHPAEIQEMKQVIKSLELSDTLSEMVEKVYRIAFNCGRIHENNERIATLQERINANK